MKILVTGGAGFIGSHICKRLLGRKESVVCIDNFDDYYDPALKRERISALEAMDGDFELVEGDICDKDLVSKLCEGVDYIFHEAAQAGVRVSVEDPIKPYKINVFGLLNILTAARDAGVQKVINASSSSVYGKIKYMPFDEEHPKNPLSPYGVSKLAAEHYCNVFSDLYGLKTANLRYFTVYGPGMRPDLAISIFTRKALGGEDIEIFGDGNKTRDFTHIYDIVDANMLLLDKGEGNLNIGCGNRVSIKDLAEKIIAITDSDSEITFGNNAAGDVEHTLADVSKTRNVLSWVPERNIDDGLREYVESVKEDQIF